MVTMKRFFCIIFVFSLFFIISSCSGIQKNSEELTTTEHTPTQTEAQKENSLTAVQSSAVNQIPFEIPTLAERTAGNLELTVKEAHAGDKTINARITDYDNQGFVLDLSLFELEKYNGTEWINITDSTIFSNASSILPQNEGNAAIDFRIFVSHISNQPLEQGKYRLKGTVSGYAVAAEFEVLP